jgi:hypothetical protein
LAVARAVPAAVWSGVFTLVGLILACGAVYYLVRAADLSLERADALYDGGKRGEAAALYRQHPQQLLRPDGSGARYLRRLIEHDLEKGDVAEARSWMMKSLEGNVALEFNSPEAADLHHQLKGERDQRLAQARAEEEARRKAAAEAEERRQREERERMEEVRRRQEEMASQEQGRELARVRAAEKARERAEKEARERAEQKKAELEERRRQEEVARLDKKAAPHLVYAKKLIDRGEYDQARSRLQEIIRDYLGTPSAKEAKRLLKELD